VETGYPDNGRADYKYAQGIAPSVDGGTAHTRELGPHCKPNWDVQVRFWDLMWARVGYLWYDSFTGIKPEQSKRLIENSHIYLTGNGRISMAGLNSHNILYFARELDSVVRGSVVSSL